MEADPRVEYDYLSVEYVLFVEANGRTRTTGLEWIHQQQRGGLLVS
jgi:hypothetical protein